jgi:methyltransferase
MTYFLIFLSIIIIQRISELILANRNEKYLKSQGANEYDKNGYKYIVLMHNLFFISFVLEFIFLKRQLNQYWAVLLIIFICTQLLRYWAIFTLGKRWNTKILVLPDVPPINSGLYKHLKHPNYIAVIIEFAIIPLLFSCYFTAIIFSVLNLIVLKRRVRIEEEALNIN